MNTILELISAYGIFVLAAAATILLCSIAWQQGYRQGFREGYRKAHCFTRLKKTEGYGPN